jgi:hypothetical protein
MNNQIKYFEELINLYLNEKILNEIVIKLQIFQFN